MSAEVIEVRIPRIEAMPQTRACVSRASRLRKKGVRALSYSRTVIRVLNAHIYSVVAFIFEPLRPLEVTAYIFLLKSMKTYFLCLCIYLVLCCAEAKDPLCNMCIGGANALRSAIRNRESITRAAERYCTETVRRGMVKACKTLMKSRERMVQDLKRSDMAINFDKYRFLAVAAIATPAMAKIDRHQN
ncbi:hypothetical protein Y032_0143g2428 [Ancylostoma ceylanicum]|uniref:Saposin B-type domain-containing protein n=1 Tax=Ancylostoma ceylanicum TaxID=53326 RepID=A0A016T372_9BILA|nr:hypothetical protein Y032_0143g2428 [Ancylostoma ceylanicum]